MRLSSKWLRTAAACVAVASSLSAAPVRALPAGVLSSDNVELVATIPDPGMIGGRIIGDTLYVTGSQGLRIYDVSRGVPVPKGALQLPHFENEDVDTNGRILLIAADHALSYPSLLYVVDVSNPSLPILTAPPLSLGDAHTASCINDCSYAWIGGYSDWIEVIDLRDPSQPRASTKFPVPGRTHDVQVDESGVAWASTSRGLFGFTTANPEKPVLVAAKPNNQSGSFKNNFILHNSLRPNALSARTDKMADSTVDRGELLLVTEENWLAVSNGLCANDGRFQTGWYHTVNGSPVVERLDDFNLSGGTLPPTLAPDRNPQPVISCSSHYLDYRDGIAAVAWYEQGVRFLDVSNPRDIRQVGYWLPPATEAWQTLFHREYVYVFDYERGLDVLKFTGSSASSESLAPHYNLASPIRAPSPQWGYACRIS